MIKNHILKYTSTLVFVKKTDDRARLPSAAHTDDVGFDLYPLADVVLNAGTTTIVSIGVCLAETIEPFFEDEKIRAVPFLKIEGRSGLASKGIFPVGGIIDPSYRGEIKVILFNSTQNDYFLSHDKAAAQLIAYYTLASCPPHNFVKFVWTDSSSETDRGNLGFGSTDKS
jgi:dUTP pyrophosphatase